MADRSGLKLVGFIFATVTVAVMLTAAMVVKGASLSSTKLVSSHFEAGQKFDVALLTSSAALTDAEFFRGCAIGRPAFGQLVLGICFVFPAGRGPLDDNSRCFLVAVLHNRSLLIDMTNFGGMVERVRA